MKRMCLTWATLASLLYPLFSQADILVAHRFGFQSAEHMFMGGEVQLKLPNRPSTNTISFTLSSGIQMSYGEILAMPDYYGDPQEAISSEPTLESRIASFNNFYHRFDEKDPAYFHAFWPIVEKEREAVYVALQEGQDPTAVYTHQNGQEDISLALATQLNYLFLAITDYDHFGEDAVLAYQAGHAAAVQTAIAAYQIQQGQSEADNQLCRTRDTSNFSDCLSQRAYQKLLKAYAKNAFASHFLADRFASGHMRDPLRRLHDDRPLGVLGAYSAEMMHNEDNRLGLIVDNAKGERWLAYGDDYYFSQQNATNRNHLTAALQQSADEIYAAYQEGKDPDPNSADLEAALPIPLSPGEVVQLPGMGVLKQTYPLYALRSNHVWQRLDINNPYDSREAWIWSTVLTAIFYKHPQAEPRLSTKWALIFKASGHGNLIKQISTGP